jgi:hypothetical protein
MDSWFRRRRFDEFAVSFDTRRSRLQTRQGFDGGGSLRPGVRFEELAQQDKRDDAGRGLEIDMKLVQSGQRDHGAIAPGHAWSLFGFCSPAHSQLQ